MSCFQKNLKLKGGKSRKDNCFGCLKIKAWDPEVEELKITDMLIGWKVSTEKNVQSIIVCFLANLKSEEEKSDVWTLAICPENKM